MRDNIVQKAGDAPEPERDFNIFALVEPALLARVLRSFTLATGLGAAIVDRSGERLELPGAIEEGRSFCSLIQSTELGKERCREELAKAGEIAAKLGDPYIFRCHAGLIEWSAPIVQGDHNLGSICCGPVLMWSLDDLALQEIVSRNRDLGVPEERLVGAAREVKVVSSPKVQAGSELLFIIANHVMKVGYLTLQQRKELTEQQARLAEEIHARKNAEELVRALEERAKFSIYPLEKEQELLGKVRTGDRAGAKEILNMILAEIFMRDAGNNEVIKARVLELLVVLSRAAVEGGASLEKLLGVNYRFITEVAGINDFEGLCRWIVRALDSFIDAIYETRDIKNIRTITEAMAYIKANYMKSITLDDVAQSVLISPFYLSHLFRKELGITFLDYLTRVRIEEAKRLLATTNLSVNEVANRVGYEDGSYFARTFRKVVNLTPSQYRRLRI